MPPSGDDMSLRAFAHRAILAAASKHRRRVAEAAQFVAARSAELNRRLARPNTSTEMMC